MSDSSDNFTTTRGNNAVAHTNPKEQKECVNCHRPQNRKLKFDYDYDVEMDDPEKYRDAAVTQAFYTVNKCHDIYYTLGFNEVAGNFQANNNDKGGLENDHVIVSVQVGTLTNNAMFENAPEGNSPHMWLYLFNQTTPVRDVAFDQNVVTHEYTHGGKSQLNPLFPEVKSILTVA